MIRNHEQFVRHYIRCRDAQKAYKKIYPHANKESIRTGAARLMAREDVTAAIEKLKGPRDGKEIARLQEVVKEQMKLDIIDTLHKRHLCAQIMLCKQKVPRHFKFKDHTETKYEDPGPAAILRAIELDTKLELGWFDRKKQPTTGRHNEEPAYPNGFDISISGEGFPEEKEELLRRLWELDNPEKVKIISHDKVANEDGTVDEDAATVSFLEYTEDPPWVTDHGWYEKQGAVTTPKPTADASNSPDQGNQQNRASELTEANEGTSKTVALCSNDAIQTPGSQPTIPKHPERHRATSMTHIAPNTLPPNGINVPQKEMQPKEVASLLTPLEEGYTPLGETLQEYYITYLNNQHSGTYRAYRNIEILRDARHQPPAERKKMEQQAGWEFHPDSYGYIRKIR